MNAKQDNILPHSFAVKTLDPERITDPQRAKDLLYMRREFRMWVGLPPTYNVVPALSINEVVLPSHSMQRTTRLPFVVMPRLSGSLDAWIGVDNPGQEDRLIALGQAFNGLRWLYDHGFEGHGDLKPSNILFSNLSDRFSLKEEGTWPSKKHPWQIRVADLGWADAWVDLGLVNKALRRYLAPERLGEDSRVVPHKSDIFSMGVIASELLQGRHPAQNVKKIDQSVGGAKKWALSGQRVFDRIESSTLRLFLESCLSPEPRDRPSIEECISTICEELRHSFDHDIEATLAQWRSSTTGDVAADHEHAAWAAAEIAVLGHTEIPPSEKDLEQRLQEIDVSDLGTCESWSKVASSLIVLLQKGELASVTIGQLRDRARDLLRANLGCIDRETLATTPPSGDFLRSSPFRRLATAVHQLAEIADLQYDSPESRRLGLGKLALSAWAFATASNQRFFLTPAAVEAYLAEAIALAPDEPVPYYFRAFWSYSQWLSSSAFESLKGKAPTLHQLDQWIDDLQKAGQLDPSWAEPKLLLKEVCNHDLSADQ